MIVYVDLIFLLNFLIDMLLLITVSITLKRKVKIKRIFFGAFVGSITLLFLFIKINSLELFILKIVIALLMLITTFGYKNLRFTLNNFVYLYLISIIYGGFLYFLQIEFAYKNNGLIFYNNGLSFNFIVLLLISPVIIFLYLKTNKKIQNDYSNYHNVCIYFKEKRLDLVGMLDTGNNLKDPYFHRPVILINKKLINLEKEKFIYVVSNTISDHSLIKCYKPSRILIDNKEVKSVLVGLIDNDIFIDNVECILHKDILERRVIK